MYSPLSSSPAQWAVASCANTTPLNILPSPDEGLVNNHLEELLDQPAKPSLTLVLRPSMKSLAVSFLHPALPSWIALPIQTKCHRTLRYVRVVEADTNIGLVVQQVHTFIPLEPVQCIGTGGSPFAVVGGPFSLLMHAKLSAQPERARSVGT
jgi:hypothetical protein